MTNLSTLLSQSASQATYDFVLTCTNEDDLVSKIQKNPSQAVSILQNMEMKGNERLAARLLYHIDPKDLENRDVKKIETLLRNQGHLKRSVDPDFTIQGGDQIPLEAHKVILALECPHFKSMIPFKEFKSGVVQVEDLGIDQEVVQLVVDYLYLPDKERKGFVTMDDPNVLAQMAALSHLWDIEELTTACDEKLFNLLVGFDIESTDLDQLIKQSHCLPKTAMLAGFIQRIAQKGEVPVNDVVEKMNHPREAGELVAKCNQEEKRVFATLQTEFGKICRVPEGTFGQEEWEKTFSVTLEEVPQIPDNIHAILEQPDPFAPDKKLKDTCFLFLYPEKVQLHKTDGSTKELLLNFTGVEELAKHVNQQGRGTTFTVEEDIRSTLNQIPAEKSHWVLMRREAIPGSLDARFAQQQQLLKGQFEVPKAMDTILLHTISYANEGKSFFGEGKIMFTRCQEDHAGYQIILGGTSPTELRIYADDTEAEGVCLIGTRNLS